MPLKEKIIARIKAKFPALNFGTKRLDAIADRLDTKITDENEIDAKLDEFNELFPFEEIAKTDDKVRDLTSKVKNAIKPADTPSQSSSQQQQTTTAPADDTPAWAKSLVESNQKLAEKLEKLEKEKTQQSLQAKLAANEKLKGVSPVFYNKRPLPEKEEDLEAFVDEIKADWDTMRQESNNEALGGGTRPVTGTTTPAKTSSIFDEVMADRKKQAEAANKN